MGDVERAQPRLGAGAGAGGALVADLAADAGGGPGPGGDRRGVVVGLHLAEDVGLPALVAVAEAVAVGPEDLGGEALDDPGVVGVGLHRVLGMAGVGVADHVEEGALLALAVDDPRGVEDLVPAVLGVDVGEHHQLDVGGIAAEAEVGVGQVVDFLGGQGQPPAGVGLHQGGASVAAEGNRLQGTGLVAREETLRGVDHRFRHAVVQQGEQGVEVRDAGAREGVAGAAFDAVHGGAAVGGDVGGLARPRRDRPRPRGHEEGGGRQVGREIEGVAPCPGAEDLGEAVDGPGRRRLVEPGHVEEAGVEGAHAGGALPTACEQGRPPKWGQRRRAVEELQRHPCSREEGGAGRRAQKLRGPEDRLKAPGECSLPYSRGPVSCNAPL